MKIPASAWRGLQATPREARDLQRVLSRQVVRSDSVGRVRTVAGVDIAFPEPKTAQAAAVLMSLPGLEIAERHVVRRPVAFPYVPGLLSFRELPAILDVLKKLNARPDLVMCDGQGYAHPRRLGIASHLGVLLDLPTIGVAKSRLVGEHGPVPGKRGEWIPLVDRGERIGALLCTRDGVRPLYVSAGHRISLRNAIRQVMRCALRYRLPEPTRLADKLSRA